MNDSESPGGLRALSAAGDPAAGSLGQRVRSLRLPERSKHRRSVWAWMGWLLCLVFAAATSVFGYLLYQQGALFATPPSTAPAAAKPPDTASGPSKGLASPQAAAGPQDVVLESKGYVIPAHQILVSPQVSGRLLKLHIVEGQRVKAGDILGEIEDTEYRTDVNRTAAALELAEQGLLELQRGNRPEEIEQAKLELAESNAQLAQLESQWKRQKQLRESNAITDQEYEEAESKYLAMQRRVDRLTFAFTLMQKGPREERIAAARAQANEAKAELEKAQWKLENCLVRAPISGTILRKNAEEGNIVNPVAFNGSYSLCDMADLSDLEVDLNIQERDISRVFQGQRCQVRADAYPNRVYEGVVSRLMPIADRAKGAVPVRVKLTVPAEEEGVYLKPEMGAVVAFLGNSPVNATESHPAEQLPVPSPHDQGPGS